MSKLLIASANVNTCKNVLSRLKFYPNDIIVLDQSKIALKEIENEFHAVIPKLQTFCIDWSNLEDINATLQQLIEEFYNIELVLSLLDQPSYNIAGKEYNIEEVYDVHNINYLSNATLLHNLLPSMKQENKGQFFFIGERRFTSNEFIKFYHETYHASKAALQTHCREAQKKLYGTDIRISLMKIEDPTTFKKQFINGRQLTIIQDEKSILEQNSNTILSFLKTK